MIERLYEVFAAPRPRVVGYCVDTTPRAFAALVEECTGDNAPGERPAKWVSGRETR